MTTNVLLIPVEVRVAALSIDHTVLATDGFLVLLVDEGAQDERVLMMKIVATTRGLVLVTWLSLHCLLVQLCTPVHIMLNKDTSFIAKIALIMRINSNLLACEGRT